jgi:hypothetical protein
MLGRQPELWETTGRGLSSRSGRREAPWRCGRSAAMRFAVRAPGREEVLVGFEEAREAAHRRANELGEPI